MRRLRPALVGVLVLLAGLPVLARGGPAAGAGGSVPASAAGFSPGAGILWESATDQAHDLDVMAATGARWLRLDFPWPSVQPSATQWNWAPFDAIVAAARSRGFSILGVASYTPGWARAPGTGGSAPPNGTASYAAFVRALATRYAPQGVHAWEIWNEPNLAGNWNPPSAGGYTNLVKAAYPAIKAADPSATVLAGALSPATDESDGSQISPVTFVQSMYAAGVKGSFDALSVHPYSFPAMPMDPASASWNTFYRLPLIHQAMADRGDGAKKIWLTEFGAPTGSSAGAVSQATQADMVGAAFTGAQAWSWAGPLFWYAGRDTGTNPADREQNFGLLRHDFSAKPAYAAFDALVASAGTTTTAPPTTSPPTTGPPTTSPPTTTPPTTPPPPPPPPAAGLIPPLVSPDQVPSDADPLRPLVAVAFAFAQAVPVWADLAPYVASDAPALRALADAQAARPAFEARYGDLDDDAFLAQLGEDLLGRPLTADDLGALAGASPLDRAGVVLAVAQGDAYVLTHFREISILMAYAYAGTMPSAADFADWLARLDALPVK